MRNLEASPRIRGRLCVDIRVFWSAQVSHAALYITHRGKPSRHDLPSPLFISITSVSVRYTAKAAKARNYISLQTIRRELQRHKILHHFVRVNQGHQLALLRCFCRPRPTLLDRPEITEARVTPGPQPELTRPPPPIASACLSSTRSTPVRAWLNFARSGE